jgi:hypothetical protein
MTYWGFVIDIDPTTVTYGNDFCTHLTGWKEESERLVVVDEELAQQFPNLISKPDRKEGYWSPWDVFPNPHYKNSGMGFCHKPGEESLVLEKKKQSLIDYGDNIFNSYIATSPDYAKSQKDKYESLAASQTLADITFEAYTSIIIYFASEPTPEQIDIMKSRAESFVPSKYYKKPTIEGFRLVKFVETQEIVDL